MAGESISTHILDLVRGKPASGITVHLYQEDELVADGVTNTAIDTQQLLYATGAVLHGQQSLAISVRTPAELGDSRLYPGNRSLCETLL